MLADEGPEGPAKTDQEITEAIGTPPATLERLRKRCCEVGPLGALESKQRATPPREIKVTGEVEAHITRLACSEPPEGHACWTLAIIAEKLVEIEVVESIGRTSVATVLKKANLSLGVKNAGASHPKKTPVS